MKDYVIEQINKEIAEYLIFGVTVNSPLFELNEIKDSLPISSGEKVVFDQLLQTGNNENRFLIMTFDNGDFDFYSAKNISNQLIQEDIRSIISNYLRGHDTILKYSILPSKEKLAIVNGGNI